jgi:hypothetical protein
VSDGKIEALFSLAPGSPTLTKFQVPNGLGGMRDLSPADILYTDFSGQFDIAGPTGLLGNFPNNFLWKYDLTAQNIGLLPTDNVDALDISETMTSSNIPMNPIPLGVEAVLIPEPAAMVYWGLGSLALIPPKRRRICRL